MFTILLLVALADCSQPADRTPDTPAQVLKDQVVAAEQVVADKEVTAEIAPVLEALLRGSTEERRLTVFVQDGKLVRLGFSHPVDPAQALSAISLDRILIPPEEAEALTGQVKSPR